MLELIQVHRARLGLHILKRVRRVDFVVMRLRLMACRWLYGRCKWGNLTDFRLLADRCYRGYSKSGECDVDWNYSFEIYISLQMHLSNDLTIDMLLKANKTG